MGTVWTEHTAKCVCVLQESEQKQAFPANTDNKAFYI